MKQTMRTDRQVEVAAGFTGDGLARLAQLDELATQLRRTARPENTRRAYAAAWRLWSDYTTELGIPVTSGTEGALVGFVGWYSRRNVQPDTIRARLAAIYVQLRELATEPTTLIKQHVEQVVAKLETEAIRSGAARAPHRAPILQPGHLEAMVTAQPDTLHGLRDAAVLCMWFGLARRRSELAVQQDPHRNTIGLMVSDILTEARGMTVTIRVSKTGAGQVVVPRRPGSAICAVAAWERWVNAAGITAGPAFRRLLAHSHAVTAAGIGEKTVRNIIATAEQRAGLHVGYTGHSGRRSFVTEAVEADASLNEICAVTLHAPGSREVHKYYEVRDKWVQNPLNKIIR